MTYFIAGLSWFCLGVSTTHLEALKNRFRAELLSVATEIKRLEVGCFN
jgi:hypothetical protein